MPKKFTDRVKSGGRVRTKPLPEAKYIRLCLKGDYSIASHVSKNPPKRGRI